MTRTSRLSLIVAGGMSLWGCGALQGPGPELDPNIVFEIQPLEADISATTDTGSPWDPDRSPPEVTLRLWCPDGSSVASEEQEGFHPRWHSGSCTSTVGSFQDKGVE